MIPAHVESEVARGPVCNYCEEKLTPKQVFCGRCGHPTEHANSDERVLWELGQWEVSRRKSATSDPSQTRASDSATRTKELFKSARVKTAEGSEQHGAGSNGAAAPETRKPFVSRFRQAAPPDAAPAPPASKPRTAPPPAPPARSAQRPGAPARPAAQARPTAQPPRPAAQPARPPAPSPRPAVPASRPAASTRPPAETARPTGGPARPRSGGTRVAASAAPATPPVTVRTSPAPKEAPFIVVRKPAAVPAPQRAAPAKPAAASVQAPPKPSRADRKAADAERREAERLAKEQAKEEQRRRDELKKKEEEQRRKDKAKEASKRERKHRRHSKRVTRRVVSLDLRNGERVSVSIEGWSRFRRATLVVTNYRVALITRVPPQVRWIPLEEVAAVRRRWRGVNTLVVSCPIEVLSLQKRKRQMLASFEQLLASEVAEARTVGSVQRHHADITQEYNDRATEIWDSRFHRLRLWVRRHPVRMFASVTFCIVASFVLLSLLTSAFSPVR